MTVTSVHAGTAAGPWSVTEFTERLRAVTADRYHDRHPFNQRMHRGELTPAELAPAELRRWITNRFHYQRHIPVKDALILAKLDRSALRRTWLRRIRDHDGTADGEGGIERWLRLGEAAGLTREQLWDSPRVLPGVRFAVEGYVTFCRLHPALDAVAAGARASPAAVETGGGRASSTSVGAGGATGLATPVESDDSRGSSAPVESSGAPGSPTRVQPDRSPVSPAPAASDEGPADPPPAPPWALLAELTHACPLRCGYCSNPVRLIGRSAELTAGQWAEVFRQAGELGVVQTHLSGGEPLLRRDLPELVAAADTAGLYTQLVTSGVGLSERRLAGLVGAGLRSVQLSVQHTEPTAAERIAGARSFAAKERAARLIRAAGLPLGLNVVLHRGNLDAVEDLIALGVAWGADRIELANTQYHGWAARNRAALFPLPGQVERAREAVLRWRRRLDEPELVWVAPDLPGGTAKPCMGGWGRISLTVTPDGTVLPCPAAATLPGLDPPNVRERELAWIWRESRAFNAYRGESWMREPCRGCVLRTTDFGGCRCQAYALTGDARNTDPACRHAPGHRVVPLRRTTTTAAAYREGGR